MTIHTPCKPATSLRLFTITTLWVLCVGANSHGQSYSKEWAPGRTLVAESGHETLGEHLGTPYLVVGFDPSAQNTQISLKLLRQQLKLWQGRGLSLTLAYTGESKPLDADAWFLRYLPNLHATICVASPALRSQLAEQAILFDHRGRLLKHGPTQEVVHALRHLMPRCLSRRKAGWGASARVTKARGLVHSSNRIALAKRLLEQVPPQPQHEDEWQSAIEEIELVFHAKLRQLQFLQDEGRLSEARHFAASLVQSVRLDEAWEDIALEHLRALSNRSRLNEFRVSALLERQWKRIRSRSPAAKDVSRLRALVKDLPEGAVKARAMRLAARVGRALKQ